jgi:hypothetical protein
MFRKFAGLALIVLCMGCGSRSANQPAPVTSNPAPPPPEQKKNPSPAPGPTAPPMTGSEPGRRPPILAPLRTPPQILEQAVEPEVAWYAKLKNGRLKQFVPPTMQWKVPATVTAVVGGETADTSLALPNANGSATIKVARQMRVIVFCPDNPDEFVITPEPGTTEVQYVPEDGTTTWNWSVTPRYTGKSQKIAIRAWVIYPGTQNAQRELPVYTAVVDVHVPSFGECVKRLVEGDPDYWLKYGLPGGAGFVFISGAIAGLWKWMRRKKNGAAPEPVGP